MVEPPFKRRPVGVVTPREQTPARRPLALNTKAWACTLPACRLSTLIDESTCPFDAFPANRNGSVELQAAGSGLLILELARKDYI